MLSELAAKSGGSIDMETLAALASGDLSQLGPTGADQELVAQNIGFTTDIGSRAAKRASVEGQSRLTEMMAAKGQQGSSVEGVNRAILERDLASQIQDMIAQSQMQGNQQLMNLPFQRAGVAMGANQQLFQQLTGAANPALNALLNARTAQTTTTQQTPFNMMQLMQMGEKVAEKGAQAYAGGA